MSTPLITELIGYAAATLTTVSFFPQVIKTLQTRDVSGISLGMYAAFVAGTALWTVWGLMIGAWPVVIANVITTTLAGIVLVMKWRLG